MEPSADTVYQPYQAANSAFTNYRQPEAVPPPNPPPHRVADGPSWDRGTGYPPQAQRPSPQSNITPGADNFSEAAAGGMAGIAYSVAERNARESGLEAMRGPDYPQQAYQQQGQWENQGQMYNQHGLRGVEVPSRPPYGGMGGPGADRDSHSSLQGLGAAAVAPGAATPGAHTPSRSPHSFNNELYTDDPYQSYSRPQDPHLGVVNPMDIEDDGDDGLTYGRRGPRTSMLSLGGSGQRTPNGSTSGAAAAAGGVIGALGGIVGRNGASGRSGASGASYDPVHNASTAYGGNGNAYDLGGVGDKSPWLEKQKKGSRMWKWAVIIAVGLIIVAAVVCGILFGVVFKQNKSGSSGSTSTPDSSGDLDINSPAIKALLNNKDLHKVFPGIDYTPLNTQYPDCLSNPPSQNNITKDVAVLSQLTNTIRLYGTDCNQTEMTLHALDKLGMSDTIKLWLGVWQDNNVTTNARQLNQMWDILDKYGEKPFKGLIVANEILFRQQMTTTELGQLLDSVRTKVQAKGMSLPVATSDLGDKWTAELAQASDYVMANIHPFFGGINAKDAASWTYSFWTNNNGPFFKSDVSKNIISETGWPSQGGTDCGTTAITVCPDASVAGIDQMNQFMEDWVCTALTNGTEYFWFEAFDEPWKISFNSGSQNWEDHWGLMDVDRNLKDGVKIPDCGGKTV
ncbi:glycoside hydrolase [Coniochaeta sp. PMI_546]|nr:glycoside hydrolase [Coniochaeta sp. PMI_546]